MEKSTEEVQTISHMEVVILFLSVYVLLILVFETVFVIESQDVQDILQAIDTVICFIFLADFFFRLYKAKNKMQFLKWGWIDFISSLPMIGPLRWGRAVRVFRVLKTLRGIRSTKMIIDFALRYRARSAMVSVLIISITLLTWSSLAILSVETSEDSNIKSASDAMWWSYVTMTTVGYGDKYPVTFGGRLIAVVLMMAGVGLFGTFTGFVTAWFVDDDAMDEQTVLLNDIQQELKLLRRELANHGILSVTDNVTTEKNNYPAE
ncbi:ion transporter [Anaerolineales bacterium HSG24]|nr:ion transporter [Anaerolineales bacterium HSG24]